MKKSVFCAAVMILSIAAVSCTKQESASPVNPDSPNHGVVKAVIDEELAKTAISGKQILWKEGDEIGLFSSDGTLVNVKAVVDGVAEGVASFGYTYTGDLAPGAALYGYYPYNSAATISGAAITTLLPNTQRFESLDDAIGASILAGRLGSDGCLHFVNTTSMVKLSLTGVDDLSCVSLYSASKSLTGYGSFTIDAAAEPVFKIDDNAASSGKSLGAAFATGYTGSKKTDGSPIATLSGTPKDLYFVVPAGEYGSGDLNIEVITPGYTVTRTSTASHTLSRNHTLPFNPIAVEKPAPSGVKNLSVDSAGKEQFSNCYLVKPSASAAAYSFALRRADGTLAYGNSSPESDSPGAAVRVVWATRQGLVENISVDWENKAVNFTVPGSNQPGSAIVGIFNDYNNSIYWLWHIWISDTKDQHWGDSPVFLDRDCGAEWAPKTFDEVASLTPETALATTGLLFQYGNSYPFPRASTMTPAYTGKTRNQEAKAFGEFTPEVYVVHSNKWTNGFYSIGRTMSNSYKMDDLRWYPMAFNYANSEDTNPSWGCSWAYDVNPYKAGNYSWGTGTDKARRDPCPQGYKVPSDSDFVWFRRGITGRSGDGNTYYWQYLLDKGKHVCTGNGEYINLGYQSYGMYQTTAQVRSASDPGNGEVIWFPKSGARLGKGFGNAGAMEGNGYYFNNGASTATTGCAYYWCVSPAAGSNIEGAATVYSGKGSATSTGEFWYAANGNLYCRGYLGASSACNVRCVKLAEASGGGVTIDPLHPDPDDPNDWK